MRAVCNARTTTDNRIIMGGEDDDEVVEPDARDRLMPEKAEVLLRKLNGLWSSANPVADYV